MDCNFPELLAHDLEASNSVFTAKGMTAGIPSGFSVGALHNLLPMDGGPGLHIVDDRPVSDRRLFESEDYTSAPSSGVECFPVPIQLRPLESIFEDVAIGEVHKSVDSSDDEELGWDDSLSSSSHSSSFLEPPSIRLRQVSMVTTATSLSSGPPSLDSAHKAHVIESLAEMSWIDDADSDAEDHPATTDSTDTKLTPAPNGQTLHAGTDTILPRETDTPSCVENTVRRNPAMTPAHPRPRPRGDSGRPLQHREFAKRWAARRRGTILIPEGRYFDPISPASLPEETLPMLSTSAPEPSSCSSRTLSSRRTREYGETHNTPEAAGGIPDAKVDPTPLETPIPDDDKGLEPKPAAPTASGTVPKPPRAHRTSLPSNIQTWLASSLDTTRPDDQSPGIPLPPDVVENLRTSLACFPDTMLLTSSLSIETIRAYSRKFKTFPSGPRLGSSPTLPLSPSSSPSMYPSRKWTLGRILSSRRSNTSSNPSPGDHSSGGRASVDACSSSSSPAVAPPWTALRSVFDSAPDNLCDALYAHLVAYNYVSSLRECRGPPTSTLPPAQPNKPSSDSSQAARDDSAVIPRKAAALLGLSGGPGTRRARSSTTHGTRSTSVETQPRREGALRELLVGLSRCIGRLIVTLRQGRAEVVGEGEDEGPGAGADVDLLLVRALCEIVRCSEDR